MKTIRLTYQPVTEISVANDCTDNFARGAADRDSLIKITGDYLIKTLREQNDDFNGSVLISHYNPVKFSFTIYEVLPYLAEDYENYGESDDSDFAALARLKKLMDES